MWDLPAFVAALWRRRRPLLVWHVAVAVLAVAVVLVLPRWYVSSATLVPAPGNALSLDLAGLSGSLPGTSLSLDGPTPQDELAMVLGSRAVADSIVTRFDLVRRWKLKRRDQAREQLARATTVTTPRQGQLVVSVEAREPAFARDLAAAYVALSISESNRLKTSLAAQRRRYLEARLVELEGEIAAAASRVRAFEERNGAVSLPDQARETMAAGAHLQAQAAMLETELAAARRYFTDASPQVRVLRDRIDELRRQTDRLARQGGTLRVKGVDLPALKQQYLALGREQASLTAVSEVLRRLYEQARVEEADPVPSFSLLDDPDLPERHSRPKRGLTVILAVALCAACACVWVHLVESGLVPPRQGRGSVGPEALPTRRAA